MTQDAKPPRPRRIQTTRRDKPSDRVKTSVTFNRSVWVRVGVMADLEGVDRSQLVNRLMEQATRGIVIQVRTSLGGGTMDVASNTATSADPSEETA